LGFKRKKYFRSRKIRVKILPLQPSKDQSHVNPVLPNPCAWQKLFFNVYQVQTIKAAGQQHQKNYIKVMRFFFSVHFFALTDVFPSCGPTLSLIEKQKPSSPLVTSV
jgi:hypothetical protein